MQRITIMVNQNDNNIDSCIKNLMDGLASGDYAWLKLFMYREPYDFKLPQDFLWVDNINFGKVTVEDIWYSGTTIFLEVREYTTGFVKQINIDINEEQDFQMVRWQDIVEMVRSERVSSTSCDQLLDFDY